MPNRDWKWTPLERRLEIQDEHIGRCESALVVAADALEGVLTFLRAAFRSEEPIRITSEWVDEYENKLAAALVEVRAVVK